MDIESLLRDRDPVRGADLPGPLSEEGRLIRDEVRARSDEPKLGALRHPRSQRSMRIPLAAAAALIIAVILLATLLPGPVGPQPSQASVLLSDLAVKARSVPTTLGPGQYYYTEIGTQTWTQPAAFNPAKPNDTHDEYLEGTVQTWVAADGSGRRVDTTDPTPRFYRRADREAWVAAGKPPTLVPPIQLSTVQQIGPGGAATIGLPIPLYTGPIPLYKVAWLPTSAAELGKVLGRKGIDPRFRVAQWSGWAVQGVGFATQCTNSACRRFVRAVALLQGPDIGETPALRQALYRVLATVPGVKVLGRTTDRAGQSGQGLALVQRSGPFPYAAMNFYCKDGQEVAEGFPRGGPVQVTRHATRYTVHFPPTATTLKVVVDPRTTTVLSSETSEVPLGPLPHYPKACGAFGSTISEPTWLMVLRTGIVNSDTAVPGAQSGTAVSGG